MSTILDDRVRARFANAVVQVCQRLQGGRTIEYSSGGAAFVSLYGMPAGQATIVSADELGADTDQETRAFEIPLQYDDAGAQAFPPLDANGNPAVLTVDKLRWASNLYSVQSFEVQASGGLFVLNCLRLKPTLIGMPK